MVVDFRRCPNLFDAPAIHHDHPIRQLEGLFLIVRHEYRGDIQLVVQMTQPTSQFLPHLGIQRSERFVEQQHLGSNGQRPRQRHPLPLPARKLRWIAMGERL